MDGSIIAARIGANIASLSTALSDFTQAIPLSSSWIQREWQLHETNPAHVLLSGAKIAMLEAATTWAIGSNRGAAASLRIAIENTMSWLYYKDHLVEFRAVQSRHGDLLLPKAVQSYIKNVDAGFDASYAMINKTKTRPNEYFYTDLSQYVHAHPNQIGSGNIQDLVITSPRDPNFLVIVGFVDEFLADNYTACYRSSWGDFPEAVQIHVTTRLGSSLAKFVEIPG